MRSVPVGHAARSLAAVGLVELALATRGRSMLDDLGEVVIDHAPLPLIELAAGCLIAAIAGQLLLAAL